MKKEDIILSALTKDAEFVKKAIPHIEPEFFHEQSEKTVFKLIHEFYFKYNKLPTRDILSLQLEESKDISETDFESTKSVMQSAFTDVYEYDAQWILDETERFCRDKAIYNAIMESVAIIQGSNTKRSDGEIPKLLQDALSISFDHSLGHDYIEDAQARWEFYNSKENKIPFAITLLNTVTGGGINRRTFNLAIGQPKGGKSLVLCSLACDYQRQGYNVLYITLELAEFRVAERLDSNLFDVDISSVHKMDNKSFTSKIDKLKSKTYGKMKIKEYPTKSASASDFRVLLDDYELKEDFKPDIIVIDYLGITASSQYKNSGGSVNSYTYQKAVSEELRAIAVEYDCAIWSALQLGRTGFNTSDFDIENVADSTGPIMTCDFAIGIIRTPELDEQNQMMLKQLASRYGDSSYYNKFVVGMDKMKMRIYNTEQAGETTQPQHQQTESIRSIRNQKPAADVGSWDFN